MHVTFHYTHPGIWTAEPDTLETRVHLQVHFKHRDWVNCNPDFSFTDSRLQAFIDQLAERGVTSSIGAISAG